MRNISILILSILFTSYHYSFCAKEDSNKSSNGLISFDNSELLAQVKLCKWKGGVNSCVIFSFDDNCLTHNQISKIFDKYGFKSTFFPIASTWIIDSLRDMSARGHEIANHTLTHPNLTLFDSISIDYEIRKAKEINENNFGIECVSFTEPLHNSNELIRKLGYKYCLFLRDYSEYGFAFNRLSNQTSLTLLDFKNKITQNITNGGLLQINGHGIDGDGSSPINKDFLIQELEIVKDFVTKQNLWVTTLKDGVQYQNLFMELNLQKEMRGDTLNLYFKNYKREKYSVLDSSFISIEIPFSTSKDISCLNSIANLKRMSDKFIITTNLMVDTSLVIILNDYTRLMNNPPIAIAGKDQSVNEESIVSLDGSQSWDPNGNSLKYLWTAPNGITLSSATESKPTFIAPEVKKDTTITFSLVVNNGIINSSPTKINVVILNNITAEVSTINSPIIKVYPNPTKGIVTFEKNQDFRNNVNMTITNILGVLIFQKNIFDDSKLQIDLSNQANGIYLLNVFDKNRNYTYKLILKR